MKREHWKTAAWVLFAVYWLALLWVMFISRIGDAADTWRVNLHPFETLRYYVQVLRRSTSSRLRLNAAVNLLGNTAMFGPVGLLAPVLFPQLRKFWQCMLLTFIVVLVLEIVQPMTGLGVGDVDDVLLNMLGAAAGYLLWRLFDNQNRRGAS